MAVVLSGQTSKNHRHLFRPLFDDQEFGNVMADTRETLSFGEGTTAHSSDYFRKIRKQYLKHVRKAHRHLQCWSRRLARAQFQTEHRLWFSELSDLALSELSA